MSMSLLQAIVMQSGLMWIVIRRLSFVHKHRSFPSRTPLPLDRSASSMQLTILAIGVMVLVMALI
jgi:hypothetical protein